MFAIEGGRSPMNAANSGRKPLRFRADLYARQKVIEQLTPLPIRGQHRLGLKELLVFTDPDTERIMLSLVGQAGTVNVPLSRKAAAGLAHRLTRELV
jgi:hypothetical protein